MGKLDGKVALVTGGARGMGASHVQTFLDEGAKVVFGDIREEEGRALGDKLGDGCRFVPHDVTSEDAWIAIVEHTTSTFGRLDVLVNNAGVGIGAAAGEQQSKYVDLQLDVNLRAIILFYRECLNMLRTAGGEHRQALVVNLASIAGKSPSPWLSVYSATKAAVVAYTQAMNKELNAEGIKSVAFCPGFVDTDMTEFVRGNVAQEDMLKTSDIAQALRFLLAVSPACVVPEIIFQRPGETI
jgi:NAD(P)-dependent dehydrogenase (short-subunit alcohol dehydrogenase family)